MSVAFVAKVAVVAFFVGQMVSIYMAIGEQRTVFVTSRGAAQGEVLLLFLLALVLKYWNTKS